MQKRVTVKDFKRKLYIIIFEADTPAGKAFDIALLLLILVSIAAVMLESVKTIGSRYGDLLENIELLVTVLFTVEYVLRIWISPSKKQYIFSFFGIIDLLAVLPFYIGLVVSSPRALIMVRTLRLLRVFKVLSLSKYQTESLRIIKALKASSARIFAFLYAVLIIITILGTVMYLIEGNENGFDSIPKAIYWAIVTVTTVGYGDIVPQTTAGKFIASVLMIIGYSIIAVPTGLVTVELQKSQSRASAAKSQTKKSQESKDIKRCPSCGYTEYDPTALYCKYCGTKLE